MEVYNSSEYVKFLVEEKDTEEWKVTYMWYASLDGQGAYTSPDDVAKPIWKIRKVIENNWVTESFYAEWSSAFKFIRDNRESLEYI